MRISDCTWFQCDKPNGFWQSGEYFIQRVPKAGVVIFIWNGKNACVTHIKSNKKAYQILQSEFQSIVKIDR
jgi:hypothetical protein